MIARTGMQRRHFNKRNADESSVFATFLGLGVASAIGKGALLYYWVCVPVCKFALLTEQKGSESKRKVELMKLEMKEYRRRASEIHEKPLSTSARLPFWRSIRDWEAKSCR
jgi:hypothetical protein